MTDTEIRQRAEMYIDKAVAESHETLSAEDREAAIRRVEAASRELVHALKGRSREPVAG
jgi:hypothetical protein